MLFYSAERLTDELAAAEVTGTLKKRLDLLLRIDLLIIDKMGYLTMDNQTAKLFFQLIAKRYE